jgi:glycosyltransferase involved in cell wall biosynthesis
VAGQTLLPERWVIVSDGSDDGTDEIVGREAAIHPWIELVRMPKHGDRHFSHKARCLNAGYEKVKNIDFEVLGFLDADVSMESDYFEFLLNKFFEFPRLGVAGTPYEEGARDVGRGFFYDRQHVHGACQLFRRKCFEEVGEFIPIEMGGEDKIAVTKARMKGWVTRSFTEKRWVHHRPIGFGGGSSLLVSWKYGQKDYILGNHPLWEVFRGFYQMTHRPYFLGGFLLLNGYLLSLLRGRKVPVPSEYIAHHRQEQMHRLKAVLWRLGRIKKGERA